MDEVLSWAEIQRRYPDEWVLLADPEMDESPEVVSGRVICHGEDADMVHRRAGELRLASSAVLFTGQIPVDIAFIL